MPPRRVKQYKRYPLGFGVLMRCRAVVAINGDVAASDKSVSPDGRFLVEHINSAQAVTRVKRGIADLGDAGRHNDLGELSAPGKRAGGQGFYAVRDLMAWKNP